MKERDPRVVHCRGGAGTQSQWKGCRRKDGRVSDSRPSRPVHASTYRAEKSQKRQKHQMRVYREGGREEEKNERQLPRATELTTKYIYVDDATTPRPLDHSTSRPLDESTPRRLDATTARRVDVAHQPSSLTASAFAGSYHVHVSTTFIVRARRMARHRHMCA